MSIFGTCKECGGETMDYWCPYCEHLRTEELEAKVKRLQAIVDSIEPGTLAALVAGLWDFAMECGQPEISSESPLEFVKREVERLRVENAKYREIQDKVESYRKALGMWQVGDSYTIEENGQKLRGEIVGIKAGHPLVYVVGWGDGVTTAETFADLPPHIE